MSSLSRGSFVSCSIGVVLLSVLCLGRAQAQRLPSHEQVELGADERKDSFVTELGPMALRWKRREELCFGKSPVRAVADASQAVNRAMKSARFPLNIKSSRRDWSVLFVDSTTLVKGDKTLEEVGRHSGLMVPPNRIYLITDRIAPGCLEDKKSSVADAELARVLLHEMGHVIEYLLLGDQFGTDRERAEGFASWFEMYSSDFSSLIPKGSTKKMYYEVARQALGASRKSFSGTLSDYALSAARFEAIVKRKGIPGLMSVYDTLREQRISFPDAVKLSVSWDKEELEREVGRVLLR